jgi:homoserine dehydrogenase
MKDVVKVGLAGFGTVGSGLAQVLDENAELISARCGKKVVMATVADLNPDKVRAFYTGRTSACPTLTTTLDDIIADPDIDVAVELMGGTGIAKTFIAKALSAGKHVVTANKALLAEHGEELFALAAEKGRALYYEAAVAGGIPIVQAVKESLAANRIQEVLGILNGTSNYILSRMTTDKLDFDTALKQAQELGYAEADPTLDIGGGDAAHKLVLLIRLAYGVHYPYELIPVTGITGVSALDIEFAREFGYRIKLIGHAREVDGKIDAGLAPTLVKYTYLLARVGGNYNAVRVQGNAVGPVFFHGQGAGSLPTASAVVADIMAISSPAFAPNNTGYGTRVLPRADIMPPDQAVSEHYFRFSVADRPGVMAAIAKAMALHGISIAQAAQKGDESGTHVPIVFLTHEATMQAVRETLAEVDAMDFIASPTVHYRIL